MHITWAAASIDIAWAIATVGISASVAYAIKNLAEVVATYLMVKNGEETSEEL